MHIILYKTEVQDIFRQFANHAMTNYGIKISVEAGVLELCAIVTSVVLDLDAIVGHGSIGEASEGILHFIPVENYVHPGIS